jgi:hypothetical protein
MFFAYYWWRRGRDRAYTSVYYLTNDPTEQTRPLFHRDQVVVEYTPPEELRPAQMGLLLDERADTKDATATIVDLAVRGYLTIEELDKSWVFGKTDWKLTKKKEPEDLQPHERTIMKGLFDDGAEVKVSDLKNEYHTSLAKVQEQLYSDAVRHKWFARSPDASRSAASIMAVLVGVAGGVLGFGLGRLFGAALIGVPIVAIGVLMLATSSWMPSRTAKGSEALRRVLGFRLYINTAEQRRQEFSEKANIFAEYLRSRSSPLRGAWRACSATSIRRRSPAPGTWARTCSPRRISRAVWRRSRRPSHTSSRARRAAAAAAGRWWWVFGRRGRWWRRRSW